MKYITIKHNKETIKIQTDLGYLKKLRIFESTHNLKDIEKNTHTISVAKWCEGLIPHVVSAPYNDIDSIDTLPEAIQIKIFDAISDAYPLSVFFGRSIALLYGKKTITKLMEAKPYKSTGSS